MDHVSQPRFDERQIDRIAEYGWPPDTPEGSADLQAVYLKRLRRLIRLRQHHEEDLNDDGLWLLDRSIFATYRDCIQIGVGFAANDILGGSPLRSGVPDGEPGPNSPLTY